MSLKVGDTIPEVSFTEVPYSPELESLGACGVPVQVKLHEELKGKKAVIIAVPGAFTPTCHVNHVPAFIKHANDFKAKGYEVYIIAANDPFVMSAFGRASGAKEGIHFATDNGLALSSALGATFDGSAKGLGIRTGRYALIIDDLKITHFNEESNPGVVTVSGADNVLALI